MSIMIETLREQRVAWNAVERPAREGDRVRIDFLGRIDGQDFPGGNGVKTPPWCWARRPCSGFRGSAGGFERGRGD